MTTAEIIVGNKSSGFFWAFSFLLLVLVSITSFYFGQQTSATAAIPQPLYVDIGRFSAFAGGKRLIKAAVVIEVDSNKSQKSLSERIPSAKAIVIKSVADFSEVQVRTTAGKLELQKHILNNLNDLCRSRCTIREVLFTEFLMSIS